jgi:hypothetical protein
MAIVLDGRLRMRLNVTSLSVVSGWSQLEHVSLASVWSVMVVLRVSNFGLSSRVFGMISEVNRLSSSVVMMRNEMKDPKMRWWWENLVKNVLKMF